MSAGGEADDPDAVGEQAPLEGVGSDYPEGLLGVLPRSGGGVFHDSAGGEAVS